MTDYLHTPEHAKERVILRCLTARLRRRGKRVALYEVVLEAVIRPRIPEQDNEAQ